MAGQRSSELAATDTAERDSGGNAPTSDQPTPRVPSTAGGRVAPSPAQIHKRSLGCDAGYDGSRRAGIPNNGYPAACLCSTARSVVRAGAAVSRQEPPQRASAGLSVGLHPCYHARPCHLDPGAKRGANTGRNQATPGYLQRLLPQLNST